MSSHTQPSQAQSSQRKSSRTNSTAALPEPGLMRRLAAMFYDGLICVALSLTLTGVYTLISAKLVGAEMYRAQAQAKLGAFDPVLSSILFVSLYLFFAYFWRKNGQTLGMQAWHLRIESDNGSRITWTQALLRYLMGWVSWLLLGLGYLWMLVDRDRKTWTDRFSYSRMVRIGPPKKP